MRSCATAKPMKQSAASKQNSTVVTGEAWKFGDLWDAPT